MKAHAYSTEFEIPAGMAWIAAGLAGAKVEAKVSQSVTRKLRRQTRRTRQVARHVAQPRDGQVTPAPMDRTRRSPRAMV